MLQFNCPDQKVRMTCDEWHNAFMDVEEALIEAAIKEVKEKTEEKMVEQLYSEIKNGSKTDVKWSDVRQLLSNSTMS